MNLDYMRSHTPNKPDPRVYINNVPAPGYDDPEPSSSSNSYFAEQNKPKNMTGESDGGSTDDLPDPTTGGSKGGQASINLGSQNINFKAPVLSLNGRAGLGISLDLNYNSNVWMKDTATNKMIFNSDKENVLDINFTINSSLEAILKIQVLEDSYEISYLEWKYKNKAVWKTPSNYGIRNRSRIQEPASGITSNPHSER